jgi:hypothetical protein
VQAVATAVTEVAGWPPCSARGRLDPVITDHTIPMAGRTTRRIGFKYFFLFILLSKIHKNIENFKKYMVSCS